MLARKKNSVGQKIVWYETISYDTSGGGLSGLLTSVLGLGKTSYQVQYTAVVESIIGEDNVKAIITGARIIDPNLASANYINYKGYAVEDMQKNIGQTRVKTFS